MFIHLTKYNHLIQANLSDGSVFCCYPDFPSKRTGWTANPMVLSNRRASLPKRIDGIAIRAPALVPIESHPIVIVAHDRGHSSGLDTLGDFVGEAP